MALRDIVIYRPGDPALRMRSRPVTVFDEKLGQLLDDMAETMYKANGVGLAGPQIAIRRRVVVIDIGDGILELVNPVIIAEDGEQEFMEGCLSVPGKRGKTHRPNRVIVQAMDRTGAFFEITAEGFLAVALCHEIDHLDGKLYIDIVDGTLVDVEESEEE